MSHDDNDGDNAMSFYLMCPHFCFVVSVFDFTHCSVGAQWLYDPKQQKTLAVSSQNLPFAVAQMNWAPVFVCGNNFLLSVVFFFFFVFAIQCHHHHHYLTCVETMQWGLSFSRLFSEVPATKKKRFTILIFLTNVLIKNKKWLEKKHTFCFVKLKYNSVLDGITKSLGNKATFSLHYFFSPPLCCKKIECDCLLLYLSALHNSWKGIFDFIKY